MHPDRFVCLFLFLLINIYYLGLCVYKIIAWWFKAQRDNGSLYFKKQFRKLFVVKLVRLWKKGHREALRFGINEQNARKYAMGKVHAQISGLST